MVWFKEIWACLELCFCLGLCQNWGKEVFKLENQHNHEYEQYCYQVINYDIVSLVSEIGGTLGLFVGFSFFSLWDILKDLAVIVKHSFK